jgi:hypothetical protein
MFSAVVSRTELAPGRRSGQKPSWTRPRCDRFEDEDDDEDDDDDDGEDE